MSKCPDLEGYFLDRGFDQKTVRDRAGFKKRQRDSGNVNGIQDLTATQEAELHRIRDLEERY